MKAHKKQRSGSHTQTVGSVLRFHRCGFPCTRLTDTRWPLSKRFMKLICLIVHHVSFQMCTATIYHNQDFIRLILSYDRIDWGAPRALFNAHSSGAQLSEETCERTVVTFACGAQSYEEQSVWHTHAHAWVQIARPDSITAALSSDEPLGNNVRAQRGRKMRNSDTPLNQKNTTTRKPEMLKREKVRFWR